MNEKQLLTLVHLIRTLDDDDAMDALNEAIEMSSISRWKLSKYETVAAQTLQSLIATNKHIVHGTDAEAKQLAMLSVDITKHLLEQFKRI